MKPVIGVAIHFAALASIYYLFFQALGIGPWPLLVIYSSEIPYEVGTAIPDEDI